MTIADIHRFWRYTETLFALGILKQESRDEFIDQFNELGHGLYFEIMGKVANIESEPLPIDTKLTETAEKHFQNLQRWVSEAK